MSKPKGLYILNSADFPLIYGPGELADIDQHVDIVAEPMTAIQAIENYRTLKETQFIFSGWGAPVLDETFLQKCPELKVFFFGAGSVTHLLTRATWDHGVRITSAILANSRPVAEYALATIIFSLKSGWRLARQTRAQRTFVDRNVCKGCYKSTVGLVSMGITARTLRKLLRSLDVNVIVYDPYLSVEESKALNVEVVSLQSLFECSDVISIHTPILPETVGMITGRHLASMKQGASLINTSRGTIVRQSELIDVASRRPDLQFVLDVAEPEPPESTSLLYTLANVVLTPHIAGSAGDECRRMGRCMVNELERYLDNEQLEHEVTQEGIWSDSLTSGTNRGVGERAVEVTTFTKQKPTHRALAVDRVN